MAKGSNGPSLTPCWQWLCCFRTTASKQAHAMHAAVSLASAAERRKATCTLHHASAEEKRLAACMGMQADCHRAWKVWKKFALFVSASSTPDITWDRFVIPINFRISVVGELKIGHRPKP